MSRVNTKEIGVALLGFGTVGAGVVETLQKNGSLLAARLGVRPVLRGIADLDLTSDRGVSVEPGLLTTDGAALIARPDVQVVVELIGGSGVAKDFVLQALKLGKPVVTANKKLLAEHGAGCTAWRKKTRPKFCLRRPSAAAFRLSRRCGKGCARIALSACMAF